MTRFPQKRKREKMGVRERPQIRCDAHLQYIRTFVCSIAGKHTCYGRTEAAHVRSLTDGGMGMKPGDDWTIPLCSAAHHEQHSIGEMAFEKEYRIGMRQLAAELWKRSPHRRKVEA